MNMSFTDDEDILHGLNKKSFTGNVVERSGKRLCFTLAFKKVT